MIVYISLNFINLNKIINTQICCVFNEPFSHRKSRIIKLSTCFNTTQILIVLKFVFYDKKNSSFITYCLMNCTKEYILACYWTKNSCRIFNQLFYNYWKIKILHLRKEFRCLYLLCTHSLKQNLRNLSYQNKRNVKS